MPLDTYFARLVFIGTVRQSIEFEAADLETAWTEGNDGIDPLRGLWVEVKKKADPQGQLKFE